MSGFIHIAEKTPVWRHVLRGMFAIVALATFGGYLLGDEGLPMASVPPGETIVQQPATLPAPPLHGRCDPPTKTNATPASHPCPAGLSTPSPLRPTTTPRAMPASTRAA
jgi:hypothetical protein